MHPKRKQKLILVCLMVGAVGIAATFVLKAFNQNLQLFFSPSEVIAGEVPEGAEFKVGGLVAANSVQRIGDGLTVEFALTDNGETIPVRYTGILPDLFREGQGTIASESSMQMVFSSPIKYWLNTMRTICRQKLRKL